MDRFVKEYSFTDRIRLQTRAAPIFYPPRNFAARPSWGLGSAMREVRRFSSRTALARLFGRRREGHEQRRVVLELGTGDPDQFVYLNENFKTLISPYSLHRSSTARISHKNIPPLPAHTVY